MKGLRLSFLLLAAGNSWASAPQEPAVQASASAVAAPASADPAPAASPGQPAAVASAAPPPPLLDPKDVAVQVRDPFKRPEVNAIDSTPRTELEYFPTEQYKVLGILTGPKRVQAMVLSPNGRTYMVYERMRIGVRKGIVESITPDRVRVREKVINVLGKEETTLTEIKLSEQRPSGG